MYRSRARPKNSDYFSMAMGDLKENYRIGIGHIISIKQISFCKEMYYLKQNKSR